MPGLWRPQPVGVFVPICTISASLRRGRRGQHQRRAVAVPLEPDADIVEQQAEVARDTFERLGKSTAARHRMAQHGKAPAFHAAGILAEELIVQRAGNGHPQVAVARRGHARLRHRKQRRGNAGAAQHRLGVQPAGQQPRDGMVDKANRDAAFFHMAATALQLKAAGQMANEFTKNGGFWHRSRGRRFLHCACST